MEGLEVDFKHRLLLATEGYRRLFRNRSFVLLWCEQTVSDFSASFFTIAVMWAVWSETESTLQTAIIPAIEHLLYVIFILLAGVLADRWNRKAIMIATSLAAAAVVGVVTLLVLLLGHLPPLVAYVAIIKLISLTIFTDPARASIMPSLVGRDLLTTAQGLFSTGRKMAQLVLNAAIWLMFAAVYTVSALAVDAALFLFVALCIAVACLPGRAAPIAASTSNDSRLWLSPRSVARDLRAGWCTVLSVPVVRALLWLSVLTNIGAFMIALWPALVQGPLGSGTGSLRLLLVAGTTGGMLGGLVAGPVERRFGAGRVLAAGWSLAGVCTLGIALSIWVPVTLALESAASAALTVSMVASGAIAITAVPEEYRGRVFGTFRSLSVVLFYVSFLAGGWIAEFVEVWVMFAAGGTILLALSLMAWANPHVRNARI